MMTILEAKTIAYNIVFESKNRQEQLERIVNELDKAYSRPVSDELDEQAARLLAAIEQALYELKSDSSITAEITLIMALEEHKSRLVKHAKGNAMSGKPPPAWVINAVMDMNELGLVAGDESVCVHSILSRAPDAEALAVAMEKFIRLYNEYKCNTQDDYERLAQTLSAHRARFPKG